ncbi:ABC transporter transmembrane domain-containing protein, partial [Delftia acidovorans]|uniref:ABC transporter transmembrane domain-containing protein n=1 Tax=Delftia acidovorans TaxID=80866 RepID=UPI00359FD78E
MLKTLMQLLGDDARLFRRYACMAVLHGLLSGLVVTALVPVLSRLLAGDTRGAAAWLAVLLAGVVLCWAWQRQVEKAGLGLGAAVLRVARHRLGVPVARLPVGWFTPENTARLNHVVSQGMMEVAQLPAHVFTPVFSGAVAPVAVVAALFAMDWRMGLIALLALPLLAGVLLVTAYLGRRADERLQRSMAAASQRMVEFAQAQSVLRAFNGEGGGTRWLEQALGRQRASGAQSIRLVALSGVLNGWAVQAVFAALLVTGALWLDKRLG